MGAQFAMSEDSIIQVLRARAVEQRQAGSAKFADELEAAAQAYADLIVATGPFRASQAMARVGDQMRKDHELLRQSMKKG
jgi:hypothetical protein